MRSVTVAFGELPVHVRNVLTALGTKGLPGQPPFSADYIFNLGYALRMILFAARQSGLPDKLDEAAVIAFLDALTSRDLRAATKVRYLYSAARALEILEFDPALVQFVRQHAAGFAALGSTEVRVKTIALRQRPLALEDVGAAAQAWQSDAVARVATLADNAWRRRWLGAAGLALLSMEALRATDLLELMIEVSLFRRGSGWTISLEMSKTGGLIVRPLAPELTSYLDNAILLGSDPNGVPSFWDLYYARAGTPLFCTPNSRPYSKPWLYRIFREATEHGPHIVRSLLYEAFAPLGGEGDAAARVIAGHKRPASSRPYEIRCGDIRRTMMDAAMARIATRNS